MNLFVTLKWKFLAKWSKIKIFLKNGWRYTLLGCKIWKYKHFYRYYLTISGIFHAQTFFSHLWQSNRTKISMSVISTFHYQSFIHELLFFIVYSNRKSFSTQTKAKGDSIYLKKKITKKKQTTTTSTTTK